MCKLGAMKAILEVDFEARHRAGPRISEDEIATVVREFDIPFVPYPGMRLMFDEKPPTGEDGEEYSKLLESSDELATGRFTVDNVTFLVDQEKLCLSSSEMVRSRDELASHIRQLVLAFGFEVER